MIPFYARSGAQLLIFILFVSLNMAWAQSWTQKNNGMFGGEVSDILVKGDTIFVTTSSNGAGLYISTDDGNTWQMFNHQALQAPGYFALKQDTIFLSTSRGVFYSPDNGMSWTEYSTGMGNPQTESLVVINETLLAGSYGGLFRSTHRTKGWTRITDGLPEGANITMLSVAGDKLYGMESLKPYLSTDEGETWEQVESLSGLIGDVIATENYIVAGGLDTVYVSEYGTFWSKVGEGLDGLTRSLAEKNGIIYAGTSSGLFFSTDNGLNFTRVIIPELVQSYDEVGVVSVVGDEVFISPRFRGIFRSADGTTWTESNQGLNANQAVHLHHHNDTLYVSTFFDTYKSYDKGQTWGIMDNGYEPIDALVTKNDSIITQSAGRDYLAISTDGGETWSYEYPGGNYPHLVRTNDNEVYISNDNGLFVLGPDNEWDTLMFSTERLDPGGIFSVGDTVVTWASRGIYFSTDGGLTWENRIAGLPQQHFHAGDVVYHNKKIFSSIQGEVFRSDDLGLSWFRVSHPSSSRADHLYSTGEWLYAGTYEGVYASPDNGMSWIKVGEGLETQTREMMSVDGELFAATKQGVWSIVPELAPQITSFSPSEGVVGTIVTIEGKHFAAHAASNIVTIGGVPATVTEASESRLLISVPEGTTYGKIAVTINNRTVESPGQFCMIPATPVISLASNSGEFPLLSSNNDTYSHEWFINGETIPNVTGQFLDAVEPGPYTVRVSNTVCSSQLSEVFCVVPTAPSITGSDHGSGQVILTSSSPSGNQWYYNGEAIADATEETYLPNKAGAYTVRRSIGPCDSDLSAVFCVSPTTPSITETPTGTAYPILNSNSTTGNQWFRNGQSIPGATSQSYTVTEPGEYTVQTSVDICLSDISSIFCVLPTPTITANAAGNGFPALTSSAQNGNQWFLFDQPIADATTQVYQPADPGPYTVRYATENCTSEISNVFCVNPTKPTIGIVDGDTWPLVLTSSSAFGNQWYDNGVAVPQATEQTYAVATGSGEITVKVSAGECTSDPSLPFLITDIDGRDGNSDFQVFPVPATDMIYVDLGCFTPHQPVDLHLYDNLGAAHAYIAAYGGSTMSILLTDVPTGLYYLEATNGIVRKVKRVVKK